MPRISVIIPTIDGREDDLARCVAAYAERSVHDTQLVVVNNLPTCAHAWNNGAEEAAGDYLHFTADDLEPHAGWDDAAIEVVLAGGVPAPRVLENDLRDGRDGEVMPMTAIPFCSKAQWERIRPVLEIHYYSDDYFSHRARLAGWPAVFNSRYLFTHHRAQPGRGAGMTEAERMERDRVLYEAAIA